jgi:hypothetical protein
MTRMAVITPSFAPDFELCADLRRSVLDDSPDTVHHHIIVPRRDLELFGRLAGSRTHTHCEAEFLPRSFLPVPFSKFTVNLRRPFRPVRSWILQQALKLAAAATSEDHVVLLVDSDIEFVLPFTRETFIRDGVVRFYRKPNVINERLPRHMIWQRAARILLGLPPAEPPYADYISSLLAWDRQSSPNALACDSHFGPPVARCDRRAAPFLRMNALRRVRRRSDRRARQLVLLRRSDVPRVLGGDPTKLGRTSCELSGDCPFGLDREC